ncbi:MAG: response regulator, partial [Steroidobacteraceae bacterium]|nr:response regulator [Steroidobacteraceae bacterium]
MDALTRPCAARVLAVDDDPLALRTIAHVLARIGVVSVTGCNSGPAALEVLDGAGEPLDVIVLDLNMPGMDGIEFIRRLVARRYTGGIVLLSGEDESTLQSAETLLRAHKLRALGHLRKPVEPGQLAALLDLWRPFGESAITVSSPAYSAADVQRAIDGRELVAHFQPQ